MVEELWYHALMFLDMYRTGDHSCHIDDLYQFTDKTGILDGHKQSLAQPYDDNQVNMKIMYYELIRMMIRHERDNCKDQDLYDDTKSVAKIEGYQELTNKLQRFLNQRFILDIDQLNKKHTGDNLAINGVQNINQKIDDLEKGFKVLAADNKTLSESCASLESSNKTLEHEIEKLKEIITQTEDQKEINKNQVESDSGGTTVIDSEFSIPLLFQKIDVQNEAIAKLDDKMQKMICQANTLLINDATHLERISNLEKQESEFNGKLSNLESADVYLQESHRMLTERTSIAEKYSKYIEEKVNLVTRKKQEEISSNPMNDQNSNFEQDKFEDRIKVVERSVLYLQNNTKNIQGEITDIKEKLKVGSVLNNIKNTRTEITRTEETSKTEMKETKKNLNVSGTEGDKNTLTYSELVDQYKHILEKVEKMENLLEQQAQSLSDYSKLFSEEYFKLLATNDNKAKGKELTEICKETFSEIKSEKLETSTHLEIHSKEFVDENFGRDFIFMKTEVENIKKQLELYCQNHNENSYRLANLENDFLKLFRKSKSFSNIFEFIEILVGMNKSLNMMGGDLINSQAQLHLIRNHQEQICTQIGQQKQILECHDDSFDKVLKKIELAEIKEIFDYSLISQKTRDMEIIISGMKEKIDELEKTKNNNKSAKTAKEVKFLIDTNGSLEELESSGLNSTKRPVSNKWLADWFAKQHGTICC